MTGLLSLPPELLQAIGHDLGRAKKQFRLVCTQLSIVMEPLVLSHVVINVTRPRLPAINTQLQLLASQDQRAASFIRELSIRSLSPTRAPKVNGAQMAFVGGTWNAHCQRGATDSDQLGEAVMKEYLEEAIANMVNLQVVRWHASSDDPAWTSLAVINGLARSKAVAYLNLYLAFGFDTSTLRFDLIRDLKRIVISGSCESFPQHVVKRLGDCIAQSPEMNSIDVDSSFCHGNTEMPSLHCLLGNAPPRRLEHLGLHSWYTRFDNVTLPHLRFLKSLTLINIHPHPPLHSEHPFSSTTTDIWSAIRTNKIHLERISTDAMDASLIEYLASYSGLTRLYLKNVTTPNRQSQSTDQLAELFFNSALDSHVATLEDLYVLPRYEGKWCFGEEIVPKIIRCSRLQYLKVAVISSQVNPSKDGDVITVLINMAARHLRALKNLSITTARAESLRGFENAGASRTHFSFANEEIAKAITTYNPETVYQTYLPPITANLVKYTPRIESELQGDGENSVSRIRYHRLC